MTTPTPDDFDFAAVHREDPPAAAALAHLLLLDPAAVARRARLFRAVHALPGRPAGRPDFGPEIALVVEVGLSSDEGARRLADPDTVERVSRMLDDPDALAEAHRRLLAPDPPDLPNPWPTAEQIAGEVGRVLDEHRNDPDPDDPGRRARLLDEVRDRLYPGGDPPRDELVRFFETAGFDLHDRTVRAQPGGRDRTPPGAGARQWAEWQRRAADALRRLRAETRGFGRVYVLRKYAHRTAEQVARLLGRPVAEIDEVLRQEQAELAAATA